MAIWAQIAFCAAISVAIKPTDCAKLRVWGYRANQTTPGAIGAERTMFAWIQRDVDAGQENAPSARSSGPRFARRVLIEPSRAFWTWTFIPTCFSRSVATSAKAFSVG